MGVLPAASVLLFGLLADASLPAGPANALRHEVAALFETRCAKCHDAGRGGTKGDFGHVLDLDRLVREADLVAAGDPDGSVLYELCAAGEMPPKPPALMAAEVDLLRAWILAVGGGTAPEMDGTDTATPAAPPATGVARFLRWVGGFHPAAVHFPIALLVAAALAEAVQMARRRPGPHPATRFCLVAGALTGIGATLLGWAYADPWQYDGWLDALHRWTGTGATIASVLTGLLFMRLPEVPDARPLRWYRVSLLLVATLAGAAGFLGGVLHYGLNHYAW